MAARPAAIVAGRVPGREKVQAPDPSDPGQWQVLDLNQRRQRRRFYRPLPLAARATCRTLADQRRKEYQCRTDTSNVFLNETKKNYKEYKASSELGSINAREPMDDELF